MGDRKAFISKALFEIEKVCRIKNKSPLYETPALLPEDSEDSWDTPFLNLVIEVKTEDSAHQFLSKMKKIELLLGRSDNRRWAPRPIDIDILVWGDETVKECSLNIPHPRMKDRAFVLDPLKDIDRSYLEQARSHVQHTPLWMAIINASEDSFSSDGNRFRRESFRRKLQNYNSMGIHIIDVGAESTRPGAKPVSEDTEWEKIDPFIAEWSSFFKNETLRPLLSVDTYKATTAEKAIEAGVDIINDVSGLVNPKMLSILKNSDVSYVLTHSLSVPANPKVTIANDPVIELCEWLTEKLEVLTAANVSLDRVIFDPGVGFGKKRHQSAELLRNLDHFRKFPVRLLVGHSRKSFMSNMTSVAPQDRDYETLGISMELIRKGVDILRVHNPEMHIRAEKARLHVTG